MTVDRTSEWDLWPSVIQTAHDDRSIGTQVIIRGRRFGMDVAYGSDRPAHCGAVHPIANGSIVCALWPGHDGPHVAAGKSYMDDMQFTITGLRAAS